MAKKIGIVTGIKLEDNLVRKGFKQAGYPDVLTACAAGTVAGAKAAAQDLIDRGATHLISFGVCGGLSPYVTAGDLILANEVQVDGKTLSVDAPWHAAIKAQFPQARAGLMLSVAQAITRVEAKHTAYETTSAVAVDVESFAVVEAANASGLPAIIIRAVLDGAKQSLPEAALSGVNEAGETQIWPVIKGLMKRPQDLPALMNLGRDSAKAQEGLKAVIRKGAPEFWAG